MNTDFSTTKKTSTAASVAPEDLECGDCVAVLHEVVEFPSFLWCDSVLGERDELVRVRCLPTSGGMPVKVKAICLPFVFVKSPFGQCETIDVRQVRLVRLKKRYAKEVWRNIRKQRPRRDSKKNGG
jgi:hypothetical protein